MSSATGKKSFLTTFLLFIFAGYMYGYTTQDQSSQQAMLAQVSKSSDDESSTRRNGFASASQFSSEIALAWFKLQLKLAKEMPGCSPPVASRVFGYAGVTLYEALVPGMPAHQSLAGQLNGLTAMPQALIDEEYHWPTVANSALATICQRLYVKAFPLNLAAMAALEEKYNRQFQAQLTPEIFNRSVAWGKTVAEAIFAWSRGDGGNKGYANNFPFTYTQPEGPGLWVPTPPFLETLYPSRALQPYWGTNRPFVLKSGSDCAPGSHPAYSDQPGSAFYAEAFEVYKTTRNLTAEQRAIAAFWSDNPGQSSTPAGHSISILNQILEQKNAKLDVAAEAYAKVGMALNDAFIACWHAKYQYNLLRPLTYINKFIDTSWKPPLNTPPFPEYPSGHSVQSGAFAQVMTDLFGETTFVDHTHDPGAIEKMMTDLFGAVMYLGQEHHARGLAPRRFKSFFEAANEAAISRLYGGIHFRAAIENGMAQGKCIGQKISALQFKKSSDQSSVISEQYSVASIQKSAIPTSSQQQASSVQQPVHFTAAFQINLSKKSALVMPLAGMTAGDELAQQVRVAETTAPVTDLIRLRTSNVQFDAQNKIFSFDATLINISGQLVFTPLRTVITKLRPSVVRVLNADGGGNVNGAFYNYTEFVGLDRLLGPNETSTSRNWQFFTPQVQQFSFIVTVEGELQRTTAPPAPIIMLPTSPTNQLSIQVTGTADPNVQIEIVSDEGPVTTTANAAGTFTAAVNLEANRNNRLFATAINNFGRSAPTLIEVIHDAQPPVFFIDVPADSAVLTNAAIAVTGRVSDMLSGFMGLRITVNGQPASVVTGFGTNGTFERQNVALTVDVFNPITVVATDAVGNSVTKRINVKRIVPTGPQMAIVSGNGQTARINTQLPQPIIVRVTNPNGTAFADKIVTLDVTRSDGRLSATTPVGAGTTMLQIRTDANGLATAYWKLGSDAGQGNNRVSVTSTSIAGTILFCASATPNPATRINIGSGNNQRVEAGGPAQEELRVWVSDGKNGVANIPVTFTVAQGRGKVNGASSVTVNTEPTGHAEVNFNLGPEAGNNVIEANFIGNTGSPATFVIHGISRTGQPTSFTGLVLDNANNPIQGATCILKVNGQALPATTTDPAGHFFFNNIPSGTGSLYVDGLTAIAVNGRTIPQGSFPFLQFETVVVPNAENSLSTPVLLPPLNPNNARIYDGTKDVELTVEGIDGLKMIIKKGSMKRADGSIPSPADPAIVSLNQVHFDKIPMPMPDGAAPSYAGTLQPAGATFDPPVQIVFPNIAGLPPGATTSFLSFDHNTHRFEIVATGRIGADGLFFVSDPGSGIPVAGWHGVAPPQETGGGSNDDPEPPNNKCPVEGGIDPVYFFSGEFYESVEDLHIKGRGMDFVWTRKYRSKIGPNTSQGNGWDFSYNISVQQEGEALRLFDGNSRDDLYLPETGSTWARGEFFREFVKNVDGTYTLTLADRTQWHFNTFDGNPAAGKIAAMVDRNGNQMTFHYDVQGRLDRITDTLDRDIIVAYNANGFIQSITDFAGRVVRYEYYNSGEVGGNFGDLKSVTSPAVTGTPNGNDFPNGKTTSYTYSKGFANQALNHNLLTITDGRRNNPNDPTFGTGPYVINIYASTTDPLNINFDRVTRQIWGGDTVDVVYVPQIPSPQNGKAAMKVIVNDRAGNVKEYFYDIRNRGILEREYTGRANPNQPTTEIANRPTGKLRPSDPDFFETRYEYNYDGMLTRTIHPNGNITENVYNRDLNASASPRSRGNLRMVKHLPGAYAPVGDQTVITEAYEYDSDFSGGCCSFNFVTKQTDGRGNVTRHSYDDRGNRIHTQHRIPTIVEDFEYNAFGQMTARVWPDNGSNHRRRDVFTYYDSGLQQGYLDQEIIDQPNFALTTTYEYDRVGNVIRKIDPRGHDTQYVVNALDQVVREISREVKDGSGVRYQVGTFYDANNNVIQRNIQNVDERGVVQANNIFTTTYQYEILNHPIRMTEEVDAANNIVTEYAYDNNRNLTLIRYSEATTGRQATNVLRTLYDERDLAFRETRGAGDPKQSTTQYDYDRNRNLVTQRHGLEDTPHVSTFVYDAYNRRVSGTDPMGNVKTFNYDANSNRVRSRLAGELNDVAGSANNIRLDDMAYVYDAMNRLIRTETEFFDTDSQVLIDDGKATRQMFYNDNAQIVRVVDDNGHETLMTYDTANRQRMVADDKGNTRTFVHDANSNVLSITEVEKSDLGNPDETFVTTNVYDNLDRLIKITDNIGNINEYGYDSRNNRVLHSDARRTAPNNPGNRTKMAYDGLNRLVRTMRYLTNDGTGSGAVADSIVTSQGWDNTSRLISQTDDNGNSTTYSYDALNRRTATTYADGTVHRTTYNVHDNPITMTDANGSIATCTYDLNNRLNSKTITRGTGVLGTTFESFKYDGRSRLVLAKDDDSEITRSYNSLSNMTREALNGKTTISIYDGVGNMLSCTYPGGRRIITSYDELERKRLITDQFGPIAEYKYIGPNRVERRDYANNTRCTYQYDGVKRMTRSTHVFDPANIARVFDDRSYTWDAMYNKTSRRDLLPNGLAHNYTYDSIYRLTRSIKTPTSGSSVTINYGFDGVGNRTTVTGGVDAGNYFMNATQPEPADFQMNQYTTTSFDTRSNDTNGNLSRITNSQPTQRSFTYDYRDRIIVHTNATTGITSTYAYDALGRRIAKTVNNATTRFFYNGWQEIEEQNANDATQATYVYGLYFDEMLNMDRNGNDFFFHTDQLYNVMKVTASNGSVAESYEYEDYGQPTIFNTSGNQIVQSAIGNPYLFTGRRLDDETKFYYYRTRYLDPRAGRFISRDLIGIWGDVSDLGNGYTYAASNPITFIDRMGLQTDEPTWCQRIKTGFWAAACEFIHLGPLCELAGPEAPEAAKGAMTGILTKKADQLVSQGKMSSEEADEVRRLIIERKYEEAKKKVKEAMRR